MSCQRDLPCGWDFQHLDAGRGEWISSSEVSEPSFFDFWKCWKWSFGNWLPWSFEFVEMNRLQLEVYGLVKL